MNAPLRQRRRVLEAAGILLCALCVLGGSVCAQVRPAWWGGLWRYRKLVTVPADGPPAAQLWVHIRQDADHGGGDLRVVAPDGRPVPFAVMHATPEGRYLVAFQTRRRQQGFYAVYYDNPRAAAPEQAEPRAGLIYETRPIPEGAVVNTWPAAQATLRRAGPAYGAAYWNRVYDAYNPFGPQSDYIGIYRGYINVTEPGTYRFATMSDHSSFLLVDDRLVAQWVGPHNINRGRRGERSGAIELTRRAHKFLYVHFAFGGAARAAAAWMPPGKDRFEIMPHSAFPGLLKAEVFEGERFGQPLCADFTLQPESYCEAGDARMIAVKFASKSTAAGDALIERYQWDFGDGQLAGDSQPSHVFLAPGTYTVTLAITSTAGDRTWCAKKVKVGTVWEDLNFPRKKLDRFWEWTRAYRIDRLPTPSLLGAWEFAGHMEKKQEAADAALELYGRRDELEPVQLYEVAMALGEHVQATAQQPQQAEAYFLDALRSIPEGDRQRTFNARFALCDLYFYYMEQPERARTEYVKLRADFPQTDPARRRVALIRIGDTHKHEGEADKALDAYRLAEGDPAYAPDRPRALMTGALVHEVRSYLRRGEGDLALERLEKLLWYYPTMRLEGEPALLRVKAALLKGDFREAKKQADVYLRVGRDPNWLPAVHIGAAEACVELGLLEEAADQYRAVLDDFPESPQVEEAKNGLDRLGK